MLISQHDCDGSKSLGWWGNLLWQCSGLWQHVTSLSHKSTLELLHSADGKKARCVDSSHTFQPPLTVASPHLGEVAAAFAGLFAEFDDVPACCLGGDGHLSHSLFPIAEVHGQYHLRNNNSVMRAERITHVRVTKNMAKIKSFSPRSHQITFTRGYLIQNPNKKNKMNIKRHHLLTSVVTWRGKHPKSEVTLLAEKIFVMVVGAKRMVRRGPAVPSCFVWQDSLLASRWKVTTVQTVTEMIPFHLTEDTELF